MGSLTVSLLAPDAVPSGNDLSFEVVLRNETDDTVVAHLHGREIVWDVVVTDSAGEVLWQRLSGAIIPAILRLDTFAPGESRRFHTTWDRRDPEGRRVGPGTYFAKARVPSDAGDLLSPEVVIRIL